MPNALPLGPAALPLIESLFLEQVERAVAGQAHANILRDDLLKSYQLLLDAYRSVAFPA